MIYLYICVGHNLSCLAFDWTWILIPSLQCKAVFPKRILSAYEYDLRIMRDLSAWPFKIWVDLQRPKCMSGNVRSSILRGQYNYIYFSPLSSFWAFRAIWLSLSSLLIHINSILHSELMSALLFRTCNYTLISTNVQTCIVIEYYNATIFLIRMVWRSDYHIFIITSTYIEHPPHVISHTLFLFHQVKFREITTSFV